MASKTTTGKLPDTYFVLVKRFPLTHIRDDDHLREAQKRIDALLEQDLDAGGEAYLDALTDLVEAYLAPRVQQPTPRTSSCQRQAVRSSDNQRFFPLFEPPGGVRQGGIDVFRLEVRVCLQNPLARLAAGQQPQDGADRHSQTTDARLATHDGRVMGNSLNLHLASLSSSIRVRSQQ